MTYGGSCIGGAGAMRPMLDSDGSDGSTVIARLRGSTGVVILGACCGCGAAAAVAAAAATGVAKAAPSSASTVCGGSHT